MEEISPHSERESNLKRFFCFDTVGKRHQLIKWIALTNLVVLGGIFTSIGIYASCKLTERSIQLGVSFTGVGILFMVSSGLLFILYRNYESDEKKALLKERP